jgi:hypothetical protein
MATWPTLAALKQRLDVTGTEWDGEHHIEGARQAAIAQVKLDVGDWDDASDVPDAALSKAAFLLAIRISQAEASAPAVEARLDPDYQRLLKGHRRRFAIA